MISILQKISDSFLIMEYIAAFFGIVSVWYSRKNDILVYPSGIISVVLYIFLCYEYGLYAESGLNGYYFAMSVIGWINWAKVREEHLVFPVSRCNRKEWILGILVFVVVECILLFLLKEFTNSNVPVLDSLVAAAACTAMWWMARRKIENWYAWTLANIIAIPLYFYKGLYPTVVQYIVFLVLAIWGYFTWNKIIAEQNKRTEPEQI